MFGLEKTFSGDKLEYIKRICFSDSLILVKFETRKNIPSWRGYIKRILGLQNSDRIYEIMVYSTLLIEDSLDSCYTFTFDNIELKQFLEIAKSNGIETIFFNGIEESLNNSFFTENF